MHFKIKWKFLNIKYCIVCHIFFSIQLSGGSAAQSSTLPTFDATLGIVHTGGKLIHNARVAPMWRWRWVKESIHYKKLYIGLQIFCCSWRFLPDHASFLSRMENYMPRAHREFLRALRKVTSVNHFGKIILSIQRECYVVYWVI